MPGEFPSPQSTQTLLPLYIHLAQDASTIIIIQVSSHKQPHHDADVYRLFPEMLGLEPHTTHVPILP